MIRQFVSSFLALIAGVVMSLILLEGGIRAWEHLSKAKGKGRGTGAKASSRAVIPSSDPHLIFELSPGWSDGEFSVNSHGMADKELSVRKAEDELRIAFVGDSISCGFRLIQREKIFLFRVQETLSSEGDRRSPIRCLNFGVNGYGVMQLVRMAESRVPLFDAEILVVQLCLNDPFPSGGLVGPYGPKWSVRSARLLLKTLWPRRFWAHQLVERVWNADGREQMSRGLGEFGKLNQHGIPVLVVLFPYLDQAAYRSWGFGEFHEKIRKACEENGLAFLDLYDLFDEAGLIEDRWPMDPLHPGPEGHRIAAESVARTLAQNGWLPRGAPSG